MVARVGNDLSTVIHGREISRTSEGHWEIPVVGTGAGANHGITDLTSTTRDRCCTLSLVDAHERAVCRKGIRKNV